MDRRVFLLGDGRRMEHDVGETRIRIDGRLITSLVAFGDEQAGPVLGAVTLESFGLAVDPVQRRLVSVDAFLMAFDLAGGR